MSKIFMDDLMPTTPAVGDTISKETNDFTQLERDPKDDGVVLTQPAVEGLVAPLVPSTNDPTSKAAESPSALDTKNPPS